MAGIYIKSIPCQLVHCTKQADAPHQHNTCYNSKATGTSYVTPGSQKTHRDFSINLLTGLFPQGSFKKPLLICHLPYSDDIDIFPKMTPYFVQIKQLRNLVHFESQVLDWCPVLIVFIIISLKPARSILLAAKKQICRQNSLFCYAGAARQTRKIGPMCSHIYHYIGPMYSQLCQCWANFPGMSGGFLNNYSTLVYNFHRNFVFVVYAFLIICGAVKIQCTTQVRESCPRGKKYLLVYVI